MEAGDAQDHSKLYAQRPRTDRPSPERWRLVRQDFSLEVGGSYSPLFLVVEAGSASDAIDELAESEEFGHHIVVDEADLGDYDPETSSYGPGGQVIDLDHLMIHGCEDAKFRFLAAITAKTCLMAGCFLPTSAGTTAAKWTTEAPPCWADKSLFFKQQETTNGLDVSV